MAESGGWKYELRIDQASKSLPQVRNGRQHQSLRRSAKTRLAEEAPDIPTVDEAGLTGFTFRICMRLRAQGQSEAISKTSNTRDCGGVCGRSDGATEADRYRAGDFTREQQTPAAIADYHKADIERVPIIKAAG